MKVTTEEIPANKIRKIFFDIIAAKDKDALWLTIRQFFHIEIPREKICPDHDAPFDFIADYLFGDVDFAIVLANRSGGKTENFAVIDTILAFLYSDIEIATVGAIQFQAQRCYQYFKEFSFEYPFVENIASTTIGKTEGKNKSKVQVLTGTMSGVNSPHPQILFIDEIDLMSWPVLQQALSMPQSKGNFSSKVVLTSTRKFAGGVMQRLIDDAPAKGYRVYQWCIWEVIQKLPEDEKELKKIKEVFAGELPDNIHKANGYYTWADAIQKKTSPMEAETWETEWLCRKPGLTGVIYGTAYSDDNNLITDWTPVGKTGYLYLWEDFGFGEGHPNVICPVWIPIEYDRVIIFDERYINNLGTDALWRETADMLAEYGFTMPSISGGRGSVTGWICDPHGLTEIADRKSKGAPIMEGNPDPKMYLVQNGIVVVRKFLSSGRLMITDKCVNVRLELLSYKKKRNLDGTYSQIPDKKNDHGPDLIRYGLVRLGDAIAARAFEGAVKIKAGDTTPDKTTVVREPVRPKDEKGRPFTSGLYSTKF